MNQIAINMDVKTTIADNRFVGMWRMLAGFRTRYLGAILSLGLSTVCRTSIFLLVGYLVDRIIGKADQIWQLPLIAGAFLGLAVIQGLFAFISARLAAATAEGVALRLRNYLFDHIQRLSFAYHDRMQTGDLIERATSDVDSIRRFYADQAIGVGRILMLFVVNLSALLALNWQLALKSVVVVPFIFGVSVLFFKQISKVYEDYQAQEAVLSTTLQENLTSARVVRAFARQGYERDKFEKENAEKYRRGRRLALMNSLFWPTSDTLCQAQLLGGFTVGALMAMRTEITLGEYMAYIGMLGLLIWPMREMGRLIVQMSTGLVSYGRVCEIVREEREPLHDGRYTPSTEPRGEIVFDHVSFAYNGGKVSALKDISLTCAPGQVVALLGSTGSGKTSLVNLLPRFYDYTSGRLMLDGVELKEYSRAFLRRHIGIVQQEPFLFSRSIRENIAYGAGRPVSDEEVEEAARAAAIHDAIMSFPEGYNTLVGEKGVTLSGGQKQRVAIARTLLQDPHILILDDATSSVDSETEGEIRQALENLMVGRTTFIIAHRIQSVMNADQILVLDGGQIVQRGMHDELIEQQGPYRQIFDLQFRMETELERELADVEL